MPQEPYDWWEGWWRLLQLGNMLAKDAAGILLIAGIAHGLEFALGYISPHPMAWDFWVVTITLSQIVSYGDLFVIVVFFYVAFRHILKWAKH